MRQMPTQIPAREVRQDPEGGWYIPAVLHQTFKTAEVTEAMHAAARSWIDLNPEYEYRFHDDAAAQAFIEANFDARVAEAYGRIEAGAFKADFWRCCILYVEGGVYADIDTVCVAPLRDLLVPGDEFVSAASGPPREFAIYNCFICARPGHPFLAAAIERSTQTLLKTRRYDGYLVTGPGNLGQATNEALGREPRAAHVSGTTTLAGMTYRLLEKCKATAEVRRHLTWEGRPILFTEYEDYKEDLETLGVRYWRDMPVYTDAWAKARKAARRVLAPFRK